MFFGKHRTALATVVAAALTAGSADLARRAGQARALLGAALLPYAGWCGSATVLSGRIHRLNARGRGPGVAGDGRGPGQPEATVIRPWR
ncbi:tryptophan-rich sensory protein [Kocuria turfanensis]|uniref:Uncharacterized protein n=1 Tax=Kocuria turfanensis TaxID=388357 RepID=A0A512IEE7_9MICC|nr:tryptophan-rich sensory protein [Kocuria turfanensis]GEO96076.1 hypothetical protein KTU01_21990 [Kocuria turfanensis]